MIDILEKALDWIIKMEGGYVNDPDDAGGETKYGIAKKSHPDVDIKNLTKEGAKEIYKKEYWEAYRCDELNPVPAILLMDSVVQHNPYTAVKILQKSVNAVADGKIGPATIAAANNYPPKQLMKNLLSHRAEYYHDIVIYRTENGKFLYGWFRRLFMLQQYMNDEGIL